MFFESIANRVQNGGNASHKMFLGRRHDKISCSSIMLGDEVGYSSKDGEDVMEIERKMEEAVCVWDL